MEKGEKPRALPPRSAKPPRDACKGFSAGKKRGILGRSKFKKFERNRSRKEWNHVKR